MHVRGDGGVQLERQHCVGLKFHSLFNDVQLKRLAFSLTLKQVVALTSTQYSECSLAYHWPIYLFKTLSKYVQNDLRTQSVLPYLAMVDHLHLNAPEAVGSRKRGKRSTLIEQTTCLRSIL